MASGLFALLDDIAAIAKMAAASLDDVAAQTAKASAKAAGVVIDDTAVAPKYVVGLSPARELPVVWRITKGSLRNKLVFLLPLALILSYFAPKMIMVLLIMGGLYLSFEGTEKLIEYFVGHDTHNHADEDAPASASEIEDKTVTGAIRTDFILSAEIMALTLASLSAFSLPMQAAVLAGVAILVTLAVYGVVAVIVKFDDMGVSLARHSRTKAGVMFGRGLIGAMPIVLKILSSVGTVAMLWVGGSIIVHSLASLNIPQPEELIHFIVGLLPFHGEDTISAALHWIATSFLQAILAILLGLVIVAVVHAVKKMR